jgi:hypothetical protein
MLTNLSLIFLLTTLSWQNLTYSPHTWSFTGVVTETREVTLFGMPARVARVQSKDFLAWVILRMDEDRFEVVLGNAMPGDQVRVSIHGEHVFRNQVNWDLCKPTDSNYCRLGSLVDSGLLALDWNVPLSPSNEFIHLGHPNPSWREPLFWNTEILKAGDRRTQRCSPLHLPDCRLWQ